MGVFHLPRLPWKGRSIWHKFHSLMRSSPKFKMVAQISPWIAWNCRWFLVKTRKWTMLFHRKFPKGKQLGLPFLKMQKSPELSSGTSGKRVSHQHPNWNFRNFLVNGKRPMFKGKVSRFLRMRRISIFVYLVAKSNDTRRVREPWKICLHGAWPSSILH